jgi:flagellar motor switch protein FliM
MERFDFAAASAGHAPGAPGLQDDLVVAARRVGLLLESTLRRPVEATAGNLTRVRPSEMLAPAAVRFTADLGGGPCGVATTPAGFVTGLAEMLMGGPGYPTQREPTPLECNVFASRLNAVLGPVVTALPITTLHLAFSAIPAVPAAELVAFELHLAAGGLAGAVHLALPAAHFASTGLATGVPGHDPDPALVSAFQAVPLGLSVRFSPVHLAGDELERLAVGDVVRLGHPVGEPLVAEVDGHPLFLARPGRRGRRLAVEIADLVEEAS